MEIKSKSISENCENNIEHHQGWILTGNPKPSIIRKKAWPKMRPRLVWYGGPRCPRNTSKFKDNSSGDNIPEEKMKFRKTKFRWGEATGTQTRLGRLRASCGYIGPRALPGLVRTSVPGERHVAPPPRAWVLFRHPLLALNLCMSFYGIYSDVIQLWLPLGFHFVSLCVNFCVSL